MFFIHRSNRNEELVRALADVVRTPLGSALTTEHIVVSSQGMERWLSQELSNHLGVWANARFPFPRAFVDQLLVEANPDVEAAEAFAPACLRWSIAELLPDIAQRPGAEALANCLRGDSALDRFELASQIANVFDQYAVYRPELVLAWERGAGRGFQPDLWRALIERHGSSHIATRAARFLASSIPKTAPPRVSVFGASALPRIYLRVLSHLSHERDVHLFLLRASHDRRAEHPLVASLGSMSKDFERLLREEAPHAAIVDHFVEPGARSILAVLQSDLLAGRPHGAKSRGGTPIRSDDTSLSVHSCHGPMREVEVLRDQLLAAFEADPSLEPHHVIVMAPDIDEYAPLVDTVFGTDPTAPGFIPYRIADRSMAAANLVAEALLRVLEISDGRFRASDVLDLLQLEPICERFGIQASELPEVRRLVQGSGIRWGIDGFHREESGQPRRAENTWKFGLERLLLGQAVGAEGKPFCDRSPVATGTSESADLVGKLSEFASTLFEWRRILGEMRSPAEWSVVLGRLVDAFAPSGEARTADVRSVRRWLDTLARQVTRARYDRPIDCRTVTLALRFELGSKQAARGFLSGGVTFSALLPMRSIPFKMVCILGLSDAQFPRRDHAPAFDLIFCQPEPGDRSARDEDRQLFLDGLLSARSRLLLSYVGRAAHDNATLPPSVVVAELLDSLHATYATGDPRRQLSLSFAAELDGDDVVQHVLLGHPLQAFSPRYFGADDDTRLFGHDPADAEGARALLTSAGATARFHVAPLVAPETGPVDLDALARFLENPARALIQRRLGVVLTDDPLLISDREPIELAPLGAHEVGARLFERALAGESLREACSSARLLGLLPIGTPGDVDAEHVLAEVFALHDAARLRRDGGRASPTEVALDVDGTLLTGVLRELYAKGQVFVRFARLKPRTELAAWVRHLALACTPAARETVVLGRAAHDADGIVGSRVFAKVPMEEARRYLGTILHLHALGQRAPLCFFPAASFEYAKICLAAGGKEDAERIALDGARKLYTDKRNAFRDGEDVYVRRLFEFEDPFDARIVPFDAEKSLGLPSFAELAIAIFEPFLRWSQREQG